GPLNEYQRAVRAIEEAMDVTSTSAAQAAPTSVGDSVRESANHRLKSVPLGVHYEGPFVNSEQGGALHREHFRTFRTSADVDDLPTIKQPGAAHLMTLAPEVSGGVELIKELSRRGWITSIGHTRAVREVLDRAFAAGARHMTHFMNAMSPLHHRAPGP